MLVVSDVVYFVKFTGVLESSQEHRHGKFSVKVSKKVEVYGDETFFFEELSDFIKGGGRRDAFEDNFLGSLVFRVESLEPDVVGAEVGLYLTEFICFLQLDEVGTSIVLNLSLIHISEPTRRS